MRRIRYAMAMSLDGYIAGPKGEANWIIMDPEIDFRATSSFTRFLLAAERSSQCLGAGKSTMPA